MIFFPHLFSPNIYSMSSGNKIKSHFYFKEGHALNIKVFFLNRHFQFELSP